MNFPWLICLGAVLPGLFLAGCTTSLPILPEREASASPRQMETGTLEVHPPTLLAPPGAGVPSPDATSPATIGEQPPLQATPLTPEDTMPPFAPLNDWNDPAIAALIQAALEDLAARLDVPAADIAVLEYRPVVWPDSSLGCPQPDMAYTQVQRDGYLIRLGYQDAVYAYHGGAGRGPFLCQKAPGSPGLAPPPGLGDT